MKTVNFIEAVNSGKRFRHINGCSWMEVRDGEFFFVVTNNLFHPTAFDINSKYVIKEKAITITESELIKAWDKTYNYESNKYHNFKKELGF